MRRPRLLIAVLAISPAVLSLVSDEWSTPSREANGRVASNDSSHGFPDTAYDYARMVEPILGVPPRVDLGASVEIPLYVDGVQAYGNLGRSCDNPTFLGKDSVSGSTLQRYEGRTADGEPLPDVVWVAFGRNSSWSIDKVVGSVQMIGYHKRSGATAFFESSDRLGPWVTLDEQTWRMRGVLPWIDEPDEFNRAFRTPGDVQCVACHQSDPFITNAFINAAKIPGTDKTVVPLLDENAPYFVIGGEDWDMRTIHIEGNGCFDCHRVGMATVELFMRNGWRHEAYMPPDEPGSLAEDFQELLTAWREGPGSVDGAEWIIPPARGEDRRIVGDDYPHQAYFNRPGGGDGKLGAVDEKPRGKSGEKGKSGSRPSAATTAEVERLLDQLDDAATRAAFADWFAKNGVDDEALEKLRSMVGGGAKGGTGRSGAKPPPAGKRRGK